MRMCHIVICGLPGTTVYFQTISQTERFPNKKFTEYKMCVVILSRIFVLNIYHAKKKCARYVQKRILVFM